MNRRSKENEKWSKAQLEMKLEFHRYLKDYAKLQETIDTENTNRDHETTQKFDTDGRSSGKSMKQEPGKDDPWKKLSDHAKNNSSINGKRELKGLFVAEENSIQFNSMLGVAGQSWGFSTIIIPGKGYAIYRNTGTLVGIDLPNIDITKSYYISQTPFEFADFEGYSTSYEGSAVFFGGSFGGNSSDAANFFSFGKSYINFGGSINLGFDDIGAGFVIRQTYVNKIIYQYPPKKK